MLVLIDNYDSFVHNLARYCAELGAETRVTRNDSVSVADVLAMEPAAIIISPGPGIPQDAGISNELTRACAGKIPLLGVCLGHQAIACSSGGRVIRAPRPVHGQTSVIEHDGAGLFEGLANPLRVMRYHSLIIDEATLSTEYRVTARTKDGIPMALAHSSNRVFGVQFHPESVLTENGHRLIANFMNIAGLPSRVPVHIEASGQIDQSLWAQQFDPHGQPLRP